MSSIQNLTHLPVIKEKDKCTCKEDSIEPHTCPFSEEIYNDGVTECNCCDYCTHQCAMDV